MKQQSTRSSRSVAFWLSLVSLAVLAVFMAACGDSAPTTAAPSSSQTNASSSQSNTSSTSSTPATITITEKAGGHDIYGFAPQTLNIKTGTSVKWMNNSDENHLLISTPASVMTAKSIVPRSGSSDSSYEVTFTTAGTYTITSKLVQRQNNQPEGMQSQATVTITVS